MIDALREVRNAKKYQDEIRVLESENSSLKQVISKLKIEMSILVRERPITNIAKEGDLTHNHD